MRVKLHEDDRRALDLLLDRSATAAGKATPVYASAEGSVAHRVSRVEKVLRVLDAMPAAEPPKDLVARTMNFIETAGTTGRHAPARGVLPTLLNQPPVA